VFRGVFRGVLKRLFFPALLMLEDTLLLCGRLCGGAPSGEQETKGQGSKGRGMGDDSSD
jgi:hypothetical protein